MFATASMNMPTTTKSSTTSASSANLFCVTPIISSTSACGMRWNVMMRPSTTAAATMISADALTHAVALSESASFANESVR